MFAQAAIPFVKFSTPLLPGNAGRQPTTQHNKALEPGQGLRPSSWAIAIKESIAREGPFLLRIVAYSTIGAATIKSAHLSWFCSSACIALTS